MRSGAAREFINMYTSDKGSERTGLPHNEVNGKEVVDYVETVPDQYQK